MDESPVIDKISMEQLSAINDDEKVSKFINEFKAWKTRDLQQLLPPHIV